MPTRNRAARLDAVVRAALMDDTAAEVIVVVDGSRDGSIELLERVAAEDPRLRPMFVDGVGEMGAREAGAEAARGEVVLFLDDDVLASPRLAAGHARRHAAAERLVVVGYMPVSLPERRRPGDFARWIYASDYEKHCALYESEPDSVLTHLWAGNFSMRRADCLAVGMTNAAYGERYHPDRDFGLRCRAAGLRGVFDRSLRATHLYERAIADYVSDARSQGAARALLHRMYPDVVEAPDFERGLPLPARLIVRSRTGSRAVLRVVAAAGALHWWALEDRAARLLRRIEHQTGSTAGASR
jgi:glycosyltransferase involved in cell wall biosynthesis